MSVTGYAFDNLPEGPERDEALGLIRVGLAFRGQQCGRKPDQITNYITDLVSKLSKPTFAALLERLEAETARHDLPAGVAVVSVNRVFEVVQLHHLKRGTVEISFKRLQNLVTIAKKIHAPKNPAKR